MKKEGSNLGSGFLYKNIPAVKLQDITWY